MVSLHSRPFRPRHEQWGTGTHSWDIIFADGAFSNGCCRELVETSVGQWMFPFSSLCAGREKAKSLSNQWLVAGRSVNTVLLCAQGIALCFHTKQPTDILIAINWSRATKPLPRMTALPSVYCVQGWALPVGCTAAIHLQMKQRDTSDRWSGPGLGQWSAKFSLFFVPFFFFFFPWKAHLVKSLQGGLAGGDVMNWWMAAKASAIGWGTLGTVCPSLLLNEHNLRRGKEVGRN